MGALITDALEKLAPGALEGARNFALHTLSSGFTTVKKLSPVIGPRLIGFLQKYDDSLEQWKAPILRQVRELLLPTIKNGTFKDLQIQMDTGKIAANPDTARRAFRLSYIARKIQEQFEKEGLADPANRVKNWWPHQIDPEILNNKARYNKLLDSLVSKYGLKDRNEAERLLTFARKGGVKAGNFEMPRLTDLPNYRKDPAVLLEVLDEGLTRLHSVKWFGKNDEILNGLFRDMEEKDGKAAADYARNVAQNFLRRPVLNAAQQTGLATRDFYQAVASAEAAEHLSLAVTSHANKPLNVLLLHGVRPLVKAMVDAAKDYGNVQEHAEDAGALAARALVEFKRNFGPEMGGPVQTLGQKILHVSGFYHMDKFWRTVAAHAGELAASKYASKLLQNPDSKYLQYKLAQIGLNAADILKAGGLTDSMLKTAAKRTAEITQFTNDVRMMPRWAIEDPIGRVWYMFRSFYFQQAKFLKDFVVEPVLKHGDLRPLAYLTLVAPMAAEPFADLRALVRGRERPGFDKPLDRAIDNMVEGGVFGMYYEIANALAGGRGTFIWKFLLSNLAGAPLGSVGGALGTAIQALSSKHPKEALERDIERRLVGDIPFAGPILSHKLFPPKRTYEGPLQRGVVTDFVTKYLKQGR